MDDQLGLFDGPGQVRRSDPDTAQMAARFVKARATSARVRLLEAHERCPLGLTDEEAATFSGVALASEYATRCSELMRMGFLIDTTAHREGYSGARRMVRVITPAGMAALERRRQEAG